mgnify:CR=1 FL=1
MLKEALEVVELHFKRAKSNVCEIQKWQDISSNDFADDNKVRVIDAFIYRFIKLQDLMGNKLFKRLLNEIGEYQDNMSLLDVLDKLEKLELLDSADRWMEHRKLRNLLTHEYPDNLQDIIKGIKLALCAFEEMEMIFTKIKQYVQKLSLRRGKND